METILSVIMPKLQFYARGFVEERIGGTIENRSNPYLAPAIEHIVIVPGQ